MFQKLHGCGDDGHRGPVLDVRLRTGLRRKDPVRHVGLGNLLLLLCQLRPTPDRNCSNFWNEVR